MSSLIGGHRLDATVAPRVPSLQSLARRAVHQKWDAEFMQYFHKQRDQPLVMRLGAKLLDEVISRSSKSYPKGRPELAASLRERIAALPASEIALVAHPYLTVAWEATHKEEALVWDRVLCQVSLPWRLRCKQVNSRSKYTQHFVQCCLNETRGDLRKLAFHRRAVFFDFTSDVRELELHTVKAMESVENLFPRLESLIASKLSLSAPNLKPLTALTNLHTLVLSGSDLTEGQADAVLKCLISLQSIRHLTLRNFWVGEAGTRSLGSLRQLESLSLIGGSYPGAEPQLLGGGSGWAHLRSLCVAHHLDAQPLGCDISFQTLCAIIARNPKIRDLHLPFAGVMDRMMFEALAEALPRVRSLDFRGCGYLDLLGLSRLLERQDRLSILQLADVWTDAGHLQGPEDLTPERIEELIKSPVQFVDDTDLMMRAAAKASGQLIYYSGPEVLTWIRTNPRLLALSVAGRSCDAKLLVELALRRPHLEALQLRLSSAQDIYALQELFHACGNLRFLSLSLPSDWWEGPSWKGVGGLLEMLPELMWLELRDLPLKATGLLGLAALTPSLKTFRLPGRKTEVELLKGLRKACPHIDWVLGDADEGQGFCRVVPEYYRKQCD